MSPDIGKNGERSWDDRRLFRYGLRGILCSAAVAAVVLWFFHHPESVGRWRALHLRHLAGLAGLSAGVWVFNAFRLMVLSRAAGFRLGGGAALSVSCAAEFGAAASPAGVAGPIILLHRLRQKALSSAQAGATLTAVCALDAAFFVLLTPVAVLWMMFHPFWRSVLQTLRDRLATNSAPLALLLAIVLALAWPLYRGARGLRGPFLPPESVAARVAGWLDGHRRRLSDILLEWLRAARELAVRHPMALLAAFGLGALQWACRYGILPLLLHAFGVNASPLPLMLTQGVIFGVALMAVVPGGGGAVELMGSLLLRRLAPEAVVGVMVVLWRIFTYYINLLVGGVVFLAGLRTARASGTVNGAQTVGMTGRHQEDGNGGEA